MEKRTEVPNPQQRLLTCEGERPHSHRKEVCDIPHPRDDQSDADEVLAVIRQLLHSDHGAEQLKAADMLAKYHGLLTPKEEHHFHPELVAEIEAAVAEIAAGYNAAESPP